MITLWGTTFGLSAAWGVLAFPLALAVLIYAYRKRGRGARKIVPTLLLLRQLKTFSSARQKFVPPARFLFELLLCAFLALAAAGLYSNGKRDRFVLLVDNSFSMAATQESHGPDLLTQAKQEAESFIERHPNSFFKVYALAPNLLELSSGFGSAAAAQSALGQIQLAFFRDDLNNSLVQLAADNSEQLVVFTDQRLKLGAINQEQSLTALQRVQIIHVGPLGGGLSNLAISSLRAGVVAGRAQINAQVTSFGDKSADIKAALSYFDQTGKEQQVSQQHFSIEAGQTKDLRFDGPASTARAFELRISSAAPDAILADNFAWVTLPSERSKLALVSEYKLPDLGLNQIADYNFTLLTPSAYSSAARANKISYAGYVFHKFCPSELPAAPVLLVAPAPGKCAIFEISGLKPSAEISRYDLGHPLTAYLNFSALSPRSVSSLKGPPWLQEILSSSIGPLILAGEINQQRLAAVGFELFPFEGRKSPAASILTINLLKWLSNSSAGASYSSVGAPLNLASSTKIKWLAPTLEQQDLSPQDRFAPSHPGLFEAVGARAENQIFAVNYFDRSESDCFNQKKVELPPENAAHSGLPSDRVDRVPDLIGLVLAFLALDLIFIFYRGLRGSRAT